MNIIRKDRVAYTTTETIDEFELDHDALGELLIAGLQLAVSSQIGRADHGVKGTVSVRVSVRLESHTDRGEEIDRVTVVICRKVNSKIEAVDGEKPKPKDDGWIAWSGGHGCPLAYGTRVTIRTREGIEDCDEATVFNWAHAGSPDDIIAYRLSQTDGGAK